MVTSNIDIEYKQGSSMGVPQIQFNWSQIGNANNQRDLYDAGIVNVPAE